MSASVNLPKLRFLCRRGMLELDRLLQPFAASQLETLTADELEQFAHLVNQEDPDLLDWLVNQHPAPPQFASLISRLLAYANHRA